MSRKALLIACPTFGLKGCEKDAWRMKECLGTYGFDSRTIAGAQATRKGILEALEALLASSVTGDTVVIYYSGHGGMVRSRLVSQNDPQYLQYLVPFDFRFEPDAEFLGITDVELSIRLAQLTRRTDNVTVILDCCHASRMAREAWAVKALPKFQGSLESYLSNLKSDHSEDFRHFESNPDTVRLSAAGIYQLAFEYPSDRFGPVGLFTDVLCDVLDESKGHLLTWNDIHAKVCERVLFLASNQRPGLEGPGNRQLFATELGSHEKGPAFFYFEAKPAIRGGYLADISEGDVYQVLWKDPFLAEVTQAKAGHSFLKTDQEDWVTPGTPTRLWLRSSRKMAVRLTGVPQGFRNMVAWSQLLTECENGEAEPPQVNVAYRSGRFHVFDSNHQLFANPIEGQQDTLQLLIQIHKAHRLWLFAGDPGEEGLHREWDLVWGRVDYGLSLSQTEESGPWHSGDRIFIKCRNRGTRMLWVNMLNIGVGQQISILNRSQLTTGVPLLPDETYCLGYRVRDGLIGQKISWPSHVPRDHFKPERFVVVVTEDAQDFSLLESGELSLRGLPHLAKRILSGNQHVSRSCEVGMHSVRSFYLDLMPYERSEELRSSPQFI